MTEAEIRPEVEALAKMAARMAGHDPDNRVRIEVGGLTAFDDVAWRYPDFLQRAQAAYAVLTSDALKRPPLHPDLATGHLSPDIASEARQQQQA